MIGGGPIGWLAIGQSPTALGYFLAAQTGTFAVSGGGVTFKTGLALTTGSYALSGQAVTFRYGLSAATGSYALTGNAVTFGSAMNVDVCEYVLGGNSTYLHIWLLPSASYTITISADVVTSVDTWTPRDSDGSAWSRVGLITTNGVAPIGGSAIGQQMTATITIPAGETWSDVATDSTTWH